MTTAQPVQVIVKRVRQFGIFVGLPDGSEGYIRRRELSWGSNVDPQDIVSEDDTITVVEVEPARPGKLVELSLRRAEADPWEAFAKQHSEGDVVSGTVKSLMPYGVFIEIASGVQGLVPLRELALWEVQDPKELVWIEDEVEAVIRRIEPDEQKVTLSIKDRLHRLSECSEGKRSPQSHSSEGTVTEQTGLVSEMVFRALEEKRSTAESVGPDNLSKAGRVLVVDDHIEIRQSLTRWLRRQGCRTDAVGTPAEALRRVHQHNYQLLIVDIDLSQSDGLALARRIKDEKDTIHVAVMSAADLIEKRIEDIEQLGVIGVLVKPLDLDEIRCLLVQVAQGETHLFRGQVACQVSEPRALVSFADLWTALRTGMPLNDQLGAGLEQLREITQAEVGIIFHMNSLSGAVTIVTQVGVFELGDKALYALKDSPVKDVIRGNERILEENASGKAKFRKLLQGLSFESCIGVPIKVSGEVHHALFLFHREAAYFSSYRLRDALAAAVLFGAIIERAALEVRAQELNRLVLEGQLAAGMGHEIYNKISGIELSLRNLRSDYRQLGQENLRLDDSVEFWAIARDLGDVLKMVTDMKETVGLFHQLMRSDTEQEVDVNQVVQSAVALLRPTVRRLGVWIETELVSDLPRTIGSAVQLRQVFFNVMLNAAQHMNLKPGSSKALRITTACQNSDAQRPIQVRVFDTGPGIHKQLWEKIFALGFSTRPGGTGLGLFIARTLVESLGGIIAVEWSVIPIGTTFLVELPTVKQEVGR